MDKNKKSIIIGISVLVLVTLTLLGLTYAYYRTRIVGNENDKSISARTKKLEVVYSDGSGAITASGIEPGYSNESSPKTFSVENTGDDTVIYSIIFDNVINEFTKGTETRGEYNDWTYELTNTDTSEVVASGEITTASTQIILSSVSIASKEVQNYKLVISYADSEEDQSDDMGSKLSLRVNIADEADEVVTWDTAEEGTLLYALKNNNTVCTNGNYCLYTTYDVADWQDDVVLTDEEAATTYFTYATTSEWTDAGTIRLVNPSVKSIAEIKAEGINSFITFDDNGSSSSEMGTIEGTYIYDYTFNSVETGISYDAWGYEVDANTSFNATEDDYGTSYYFRGAVENNFVNYSGMCWQIVRVQGNGIIKLLLADDTYECNDTNFGEGEALVNGYNISISDVSNWGAANIVDTNSNLVETEWCEDTSLASYDYDEEREYEYITYNGLIRLNNNAPTLKCDMTGVNGSTTTKHISKYGIMTADEMMFAGANVESNFTGGTSTLYFSESFTSLTPSSSDSVVFSSLHYIGYPDRIEESVSADLRPMVAIKASALLDASVTGQNGTQSNPYVID